jgi:hypothetical protein
MEAEYKANKWPFFASVELRYMFGEECVNDLKQLISEGKARKRSGINGTLIELIKDTYTLKQI